MQSLSKYNLSALLSNIIWWRQFHLTISLSNSRSSARSLLFSSRSLTCTGKILSYRKRTTRTFNLWRFYCDLFWMSIVPIIASEYLLWQKKMIGSPVLGAQPYLASLKGRHNWKHHLPVLCFHKFHSFQTRWQDLQKHLPHSHSQFCAQRCLCQSFLARVSDCQPPFHPRLLFHFCRLSSAPLAKAGRPLVSLSGRPLSTLEPLPTPPEGGPAPPPTLHSSEKKYLKMQINAAAKIKIWKCILKIWKM